MVEEIEAHILKRYELLNKQGNIFKLKNCFGLFVNLRFKL